MWVCLKKLFHVFTWEAQMPILLHHQKKLPIVLFYFSKNGESWKSDKCTTEKCENGKVILNHVPCKQVTIPVCENNQPPVRVYDEGGCCFHYECRCKFQKMISRFYME